MAGRIAPPAQDQLLACIEAAVRAPSIHNSQPWQFLLLPDGVEVHSDPSRRLPAIDPAGRALHISLGAAVLNLRLALEHFGRRTRTELLPDPQDRRHVATVWAEEPQEPGRDVDELYGAIARRHTNRMPFQDVPPPQEDLQALTRAAEAEGAVLRFPEPGERDFLLSLARTSDERHRGDRAYRAELRLWTTDDPYREDGIPLTAVGPYSEGGLTTLRDLAPEREVPGRAAVRFEPEPTVGVLALPGEDGPLQWLRAGQAMQRVLLEATRRGLSTSVFTQALDDPELRRMLHRPGDHTTPYVGLRVGYGPPAPVTPRRPVDEVITFTRPVPIRPPRLS
ncbi:MULTISPECIES: Acg family FMN-binding oxidoreductase [Thermomonospora]|uniref:Nitroreductase n=1 Tax=Thermomonospora curvata (strain ATCC 19995 / DSM 43183 / JCM 3096 / KCTC 9072 / NBRC 15933 / NCIMB 10081 / Henssen B9) TaxID=471852 RepID=D1A1G8_THECD|nr:MULTISPECIES: nitroreductase family protein [Thermomonospora]ACY95890.1 nitroreductase [Thermomonospora curvata DSM 43183]PKK16135.1 MAG: nitroreductase [Thermomonospora sp. CIF 1]